MPDAKSYKNSYIHIENAKEYISKNYNKHITLKSISRYLGISQQYLSKIFKAKTGQALSVYLAKYRIARAKELLDKIEIKLDDISKAVGFKDYNYFFVVFKKYEGCTPGEYRNILYNTKQNRS